MTLRSYVLRRLGLAIMTLFGVVVLVFLLTHVLPGNPAILRAGTYGTKEEIAKLEKEMGLDKPLPLQFVGYFVNLVKGDMGKSWVTGQSVREDLLQRLPATAELGLAAFIVASIAGLALGILAAVKQGSAIDQVVHFIASSGASLPIFWLGLLLIFVVYYHWRAVPDPMGRLDVLMKTPTGPTGLLLIDTLVHGDPRQFKSAAGHLFLPTISLAIVLMPSLIKISRGAMIEVLRSDYVQTARTIGQTTLQVIWHDALPNAMIPILTTMGVMLARLLAGNVLVEMLFAWPGIGLYAWNAMMNNDFYAIQGFILSIATIYVFLNLAVDLMYSVVDPRIRLG